jgi:hypothetical protein
MAEYTVGYGKPPKLNYAAKRIQANLAELCRPYVYDCVTYYVEVLRDSSQATKDRLNAADKLLDRGFGKSVDMVMLASLSGSDTTQPTTLTTAQLIAALTPVLDSKRDSEVLEHCVDEHVAPGDIPPPAST